MSLEIIIQQIKLFGNLAGYNKTNNNNSKVPSSNNNNNPTNQLHQQQQQRKFRLTLGHTTHTSTNIGFFISPNELVFDQPLTLYYDNKSLHLFIQIFTPYHQQFTISNLQSTLFAEFDLTDITMIIGDRIQTTLFDINDKAIGKLTALIEVFRQGPRFVEKVNSNVLFETIKEEKLRQIKASQASKNIKQLMVNNSLTNTLMAINYLQLKPHKQDPQTFNRQTFILIRYGFTIKAYTKLSKVLTKQNIIFPQYLQFMKNDDTKFQFFFMFYDDLSNIQCKAKGEIKYIMFDETINNHTIVMFDKRSQIYGDLLVKFIQKQVQVVNINNKVQKRLRQQQQRITIAIDEFNKFKFESKNNNRILSQKLRELQLKQLEQQQQKMKPIDAQQKKKREQHSRFIQFLQREVIKIQRELKKKQIQEKKGERKQKYYHQLHQHQQQNHGSNNVLNGVQKNGKQNKFNSSMGSTQFKQQNAQKKVQSIEKSQQIL